MFILVINAGSSTVKCAIFEETASGRINSEPIWRGVLDWGEGLENAFFSYRTHANHLERKKIKISSLQASFESLLKTSWMGKDSVLSGPEQIQVAGHRVVHGGERFIMPVRITKEIKAEIKNLIRLAPLHNPANLKGIEIVEELLPTISQYAVFDTAFHSTIDEVRRSYPIPEEWRLSGIRKYGFHGISHHYCSKKAKEFVKEKNEKIITCHLGNGSSLAAVKDGACFDTTMGFTPLDGLMMGTRSGSIDPGILFYLLREKVAEPQALENALMKQSGLLGMCGFSDMRFVLEEKAQGNERAVLAFEMFVSRVKGYIGAMAAAMDGVDCLVFAGGIGENSADVRRAVCEGLSFLSLSIDLKKNQDLVPDAFISTDSSKVKVLVLQTREELTIAEQILEEEVHSQKKSGGYKPPKSCNDLKRVEEKRVP